MLIERLKATDLELDNQREIVDRLVEQLDTMPQDRALTEGERRLYSPLFKRLTNETHILWAMEESQW